MVVDKLGEQQISCAALTIVLEISHDSNHNIDTIQLSDDELILTVRSKLKKKFKKSDKLRFVVQGLEKIEKKATTPTSRHVRTKSRDSSEGDGKPKKEKKGNSKERLDMKHDGPTTSAGGTTATIAPTTSATSSSSSNGSTTSSSNSNSISSSNSSANASASANTNTNTNTNTTATEKKTA